MTCITFSPTQSATEFAPLAVNVLRIGRYRLLARLGGGGSSEVYLAEDSLLRRKVALKVLKRRDADARQLRHFAREARNASLLNHPNVITVFDVGSDGDVHYIAAELVDGETVRERLDRGPMTIAESVDIAVAVASALVAAHEAWLVHRDIKPENIFVTSDGHVKILDFGLAKEDPALARPDVTSAPTSDAAMTSISETPSFRNSRST